MTKAKEEQKNQNTPPPDVDEGIEPSQLSEQETPEDLTAAPEETAEPSAQTDSERKKRIQELEQQAAQYKDLFLRKAADFDNFKRRTENEITALAKFANEDLVLAILPVVDDIERALRSAGDDGNEASLRKGIELILQKIMKVLEANGVKPMQTVGKIFDVNYHDVLLQIQKPDVAPHTIVEEVERGYTMHDKVIRHAKVIIAAGPEENASESRETNSKEQGPTPEITQPQ